MYSCGGLLNLKIFNFIMIDPCTFTEPLLSKSLIVTPHHNVEMTSYNSSTCTTLTNQLMKHYSISYAK